MIELGDESVDVWRIFESSLSDSRVISACRDVLSQAERDDVDRLSVATVKAERLMARGLTRLILSRYIDTPPGSLVFIRDQNGRPFISPMPVPGLHFSLSHTKDFLVIAVSRLADIGVDIERVNPKLDVMDLAKGIFSRVENTELESMKSEEQRLRFFEYWTLKEALSKAKGIGLSMPLDRFSIVITNNESIQVVTHDPELLIPAEWSFRLYAPTPDHRLALAIRHAGPMQVRFRDSVLDSVS